MVEPIDSKEIFGSVSVTRHDPPTHAHIDHVRCAYYLMNNQGIHELVCPHHFELTGGGAVYTEDFIKVMIQLIRDRRYNNLNELIEGM
jgi:hypothetical protein